MIVVEGQNVPPRTGKAYARLFINTPHYLKRGRTPPFFCGAVVAALPLTCGTPIPIPAPLMNINDMPLYLPSDSVRSQGRWTGGGCAGLICVHIVSFLQGKGLRETSRAAAPVPLAATPCPSTPVLKASSMFAVSRINDAYSALGRAFVVVGHIVCLSSSNILDYFLRDEHH